MERRRGGAVDVGDDKPGPGPGGRALAGEGRGGEAGETGVSGQESANLWGSGWMGPLEAEVPESADESRGRGKAGGWVPESTVKVRRSGGDGSPGAAGAPRVPGPAPRRTSGMRRSCSRRLHRVHGAAGC